MDFTVFVFKVDKMEQEGLLSLSFVHELAKDEGIWRLDPSVVVRHLPRYLEAEVPVECQRGLVVRLTIRAISSSARTCMRLRTCT